ncbi:MAG: urease accessory protein UreE [Hydrogenophaga sp.]|uniref:urease accessory protein UreE n=1 Tax=Hydrogenophaga sp. TaxID=1904254 RepID=UPI0026211DC6|nr:urease accessory protein UreE [Hydrogenophaga sp.]MDD3784854.1 urease accessory protein UreE [Hydrogenophaga sp.]
MLQASRLIPQGQGLAQALLRRAPTLTLDWDIRQKSRFDAETSDGRRVGVFLPRGTVVRGGDVLIAEDGSLLRVVAAPQAVLRITPCDHHDHHHGHGHDHHHGHGHSHGHGHDHHGGSFDLMRAAYHLGNRHVPIELRPDHLKIEPDHVLADMLRAMHLTVTEVQEPFEPEAGAYGDGGHTHHGHGHHHGHDHDHAHAHDHGPDGHPHEHH